ncbi:MAG: NAD(P)H-dependent glycerol-3-phosphate dehydrogenase [Planctomycetota bacterium]
MQDNIEVGIIGAGAWGSCLAYLFSKKCAKIFVWCRNPSFAEILHTRRENKKYLEGVYFDKNIEFTSRPRDLEQCQYIFIAIPTVFLRTTLKKFANILTDKIVYSSIKGIEESTLLLPSQIIQQEIGNRIRVALFMGPMLAREIVKGLPTTFVISSDNKEDFELIGELLEGYPFRIYFNRDKKGVEFGGAIKNVYAIAFGILSGFELGFNATGALLARVVFEITKIAKEFSVNTQTVYGLSCLSDLITSSFSPDGRNWRVGYLVSKGKRLEEILQSMPHIPEGIYTLRAVKKIIDDKKLDLPIAGVLYDILYKGIDIKEGIARLLSRPLKEEFYE